MLVLKSIKEFQQWRQKQNGTLALVPTMGALHAGHLSLVRKAQELADTVVLYIFVNPMQFGPKEDFGTYPRVLEQDIAACAEAKVNAIFCPPEFEIYPEGKERCTKVVPPSALADILEGEFRPGFFTGVATVLTKFFTIVRPDIAVFGEKDYQQLQVVRRIVQDLDMPITIYGAPTVRESDGLAMSSRNTYLSKEQRALAPCIHALLQETAEKFSQCRRMEEVEKILHTMRKQFAEYKFDLQYLEARDADTLQPITIGGRTVEHTHAPAVNPETKRIVLLVAAKIDNIRLIDNLVFNRPANLQ